MGRMDMDVITLDSTQLARLTEYLEVTVYLPEKRTYVRLKASDTRNDETPPARPWPNRGQHDAMI